MSDKFCCYGTYNPKSERCLVNCPFSFECKLEKYHDEIIEQLKEDEENGKNTEG